MAALSALAIVAQRAIPPAGQEAAQKAILQADLERTRLDYERSRMVAEDNRQKYINDAHSTRRSIIALCDNAQNYIILLDEAGERIEDLEGVERDNGQYIDHLRDKKRKLKQKYKNLCNETDKQYHDVCFLEQTVPNDTEENNRNKILMRWFHYNNVNAPAATSMLMS